MLNSSDDWFICQKEDSDRIISYYGYDLNGTYIYNGERCYDRATKKHSYVITWTSLVYLLKEADPELKQIWEENSDEYEIYAIRLMKTRLKEGFYQIDMQGNESTPKKKKST